MPQDNEKQPEEKLVGMDVIKTFLEKHFSQMSASLPEFKFTIIAHNVPQPDHDVILSDDNPERLLRFLENAVAHMKSKENPN